MRNNVVISIETDEKNHVFQPLDLFSDRDISLEYRSNMLSSIEDITCSSSYTIQVPHTLNNDRILDLAKVPPHASNALYRKIACRVYINGFDMIGPAWCYITDSDMNSYSLVIVFGLMQNLKAWITEKPGLRDLNKYAKNSGDIDRVQWNENSASTIWSSTYQSKYNANRKSMYFGTYFCGVNMSAENRQRCNRHPWVSLREIYERIVEENSLVFSMPQGIKDVMENMGLLLTSDNSKGDAAMSSSCDSNVNPISIGWTNDEGSVHAIKADCDFWDNDGATGLTTPEQWRYHGFLRLGYTTVTLSPFPTEIYVRGGLQNIPGTNQTYKEFFEGDNWGVYDNLRMFYPLSDGSYQGVAPEFVTIGGVKCAKFTIPSMTSNAVSNHLGHIVLRCRKVYSNAGENYSSEFDSSEIFIGTFVSDGMGGYTWNPYVHFLYSYTLDNQGYPTYGYFNLVENLPAISQLDFIKAICHMFGLFPVVGGVNNDQVTFVFFSKLKENANNKVRYDWSDKLIDTGLDSPNKISFVVSDYARRNKIGYKHDDNDPIPNDQYVYLECDNEVLEKEKDLITFPWAATWQSPTGVPYVSQYSLQDDGESRTTVEFKELEYRLLQIAGITEDGNDISTSKSLSFPVALEMKTLFESYYEDYQEIMRKPKVITERVMLNEADLKNLDFTKPVYLKKYGRYFAIISARWSSNSKTSEVKLLLLN